MKLISIAEGFRQYELALQNKNYEQIRIWHKNFDLLLEYLIKNIYKKSGLNYDEIYDYVSNFIDQNGGSKYIDTNYIKNKIVSIWTELECIEILVKI